MLTNYRGYALVKVKEEDGTSHVKIFRSRFNFIMATKAYRSDAAALAGARRRVDSILGYGFRAPNRLPVFTPESSCAPMARC